MTDFDDEMDLTPCPTSCSPCCSPSPYVLFSPVLPFESVRRRWAAWKSLKQLEELTATTANKIRISVGLSPTAPHHPVISTTTPAPTFSLSPPWTASPSHNNSPATTLSSERAEPPHPPYPDAWRWKCHSCRKTYNLAVTRRCLDCSHTMCWAGQPKKTGRRKTPRGVCTSQLDYGAWERWGSWRRTVLALRAKAPQAVPAPVVEVAKSRSRRAKTAPPAVLRRSVRIRAMARGRDGSLEMVPVEPVEEVKVAVPPVPTTTYYTYEFQPVDRDGERGWWVAVPHQKSRRTPLPNGRITRTSPPSPSLLPSTLPTTAPNTFATFHYHPTSSPTSSPTEDAWRPISPTEAAAVTYQKEKLFFTRAYDCSLHCDSPSECVRTRNAVEAEKRLWQDDEGRVRVMSWERDRRGSDGSDAAEEDLLQELRRQVSFFLGEDETETETETIAQMTSPVSPSQMSLYGEYGYLKAGIEPGRHETSEKFDWTVPVLLSGQD